MDSGLASRGRGVGVGAGATAPPAPNSPATPSASARWSAETKVYARRYPRRSLKPPPCPDPALTLPRAPPLPTSTALAPAEPVASPTAPPGGVLLARAGDMVRNRKERRQLRRRFAAELRQLVALRRRLDAAADALAARDRSPEKEKRTPKANQYYHNSKFLLAKDRLPPTNSHGQTKSKHHRKLHFLPADAEGLAATARRWLYNDPLKKCEALLGQLMKRKFGWVFSRSVDPVQEGLPDYFEIIKHPMDLGTIKARLNDGQYKNPREFAEDVRLTFHNALAYNPKGNIVNDMAEQFLRIFEDKWSHIEAEVDYLVSSPPLPNDLRVLEQSDSAMHRRPLDSKMKPMHNTPPYRASTPALKKPKAKDPYKRDMTPQEKEKLAKNLHNLPMEKLRTVLQVFQQNNIPVKHNDDGVEIDISGLEANTLWALDRFVANHKKNLSKIKRMAEVARQGVEIHAQEAAPQRSEETCGGESPKQNDMVEEQLATSLPAHDGNNGGSTIRSSGSNSSESGSSSSESSSGSSESSSFSSG